MDSYDYDLRFSKGQQIVIDAAITALEPFNKEDLSTEIVYFETQDEEGIATDKIDFSEYDCCGSHKCVDKTLKELRRKYPNERIEEVYYRNDGDHNNINRCYQCSRPLNESLTWIDQEFEHHEEYSTTLRDLKKSHVAFDVICLLRSAPGADHRVSGYCTAQLRLGNIQPISQTIRRQTDFINSIVAYAGLIVDLFHNSKTKRRTK